MSQRWSEETKFILTGHSLGLWKNPDSSLITFGAPRVGNLDFARAHDKLIPVHQKIRMVFDRDLFTHAPPRNILVRKFYHTTREIWAQEKSRYTTTWSFPFWKKTTYVDWQVTESEPGY